MTQFVTVRGYAIPFNRTVWVDGQFEVVDAHAFDDAVARKHNVKTLWLEHDAVAPELASTATSSMKLFCDEYGLGFYAIINQDKIPEFSVAAMTRRKSPIDQCSVNLYPLATANEEWEGAKRRRILKATIDHVTLCSGAAYREFTGAWPAHLMCDDAPWRLREMAARWECGFERWNAGEGARFAARRKTDSQARHSCNARAIGQTVSGSLVMLAPSGLLSVLKKR